MALLEWLSAAEEGNAVMSVKARRVAAQLYAIAQESPEAIQHALDSARRQPALTLVLNAAKKAAERFP